MDKLKKHGYLVLTTLFAWAIAYHAISPVLGQDNIVQDDFRMSMFWVWELWDNGLFSTNDVIHDFYATAGFDMYPILGAFYYIAPYFTNNLIQYTKILALIIGTATSVSSYFYAKTIFKKDSYAFLFSAVIATTIWCTDHITVAQARSFIWLGLFVYMYYKANLKHKQAFYCCLLLLFLSPLAFLLCMGMEFFYFIIRSRKEFGNFKDFQFLSLVINPIATLILHKVIVKAPDANLFCSSPDYLSSAQMKVLPDFHVGGRTPIFGSSLWDGSWWKNEHMGLGIGFLKISDVLILAFILAIFYICLVLVSKSLKDIKLKSLACSIPLLLAYSSISLYFAAVITIPMLYMPSRYIATSSLILSITIIFYCAIAICNLLIREISVIKPFKNIERTTTRCTLILLSLFALSYWIYFKDHYFLRYVSMNPSVKEQIEQIPKGSMVAGHPMLPDLNMISAICKRSVFMDYEHGAPPYNKGVFNEFRRRHYDTFRMVYAQDRESLIKLMEQNKVTHLLIHKGTYVSPYIDSPTYINPYNEFLKEITSSKNFYLKKYLEHANSDYMIISKEQIARPFSN